MNRASRIALSTGAAVLAGVGIAAPASASPSAANIGPGQPNNPHGVWCVQHLLNDIESDFGRGRPLAEDGKFGPKTQAAISWLQHTFVIKPYDDIVGPNTGYVLLNDGDAYYGRGNYCYGYIPSVKGWGH